MSRLDKLSHPEIQTLILEGVSLERAHSARILDGVDFNFPLNSVIHVVGRTGAGVSSLLQMLAGILPPTKGRCLLNGVDFHGPDSSEVLPYRLSIGYGFDHGGLISNLTLLENLRLPLMYHRSLSPEAADARATDYLKRFGMTSQLNVSPALVSHGTRKACALARAFVMDPQLLILDEPSLGLDRETVQRLVAQIEEHQNERGLKHVILGTKDDYLLGFFPYVTVEINDKGLRLGQEKRAKLRA